MWLFDTELLLMNKSAEEKDKMIKAWYKHADKRYFKGKYGGSNRWGKTARKNLAKDQQNSAWKGHDD